MNFPLVTIEYTKFFSQNWDSVIGFAGAWKPLKFAACIQSHLVNPCFFNPGIFLSNFQGGAFEILDLF